MDLRNDATEGQATVAREGVAHAARGGHQRGRGEEHADEREDEQTRGAGFVLRRLVEDLEQGAGGRRDGQVDVGQHEQLAA